MTRDRPYDTAERSVRAMRSAIIPVEEAPSVAARRERLLPDLRRFARDAHKARRRRRSIVIAAAAALCVGLGGAVTVVAWRATPAGDMEARAASVGTVQSVSGSGLTVLRAGYPRPIGREPMTLEATDKIATAGGRAVLRFSNGTRVDIEPRTELELERPRVAEGRKQEGFAVPSGTVRVRVPKLGPDRQLAVRTPNGLITVHGTAFTVRVTRSSGTTETQLSVQEGRVSVDGPEGRTWLGPGESWSSRPPSPPSRRAAGSDTPKAAPSALPPRVAAARPAKGSTLAEENRLFQGAVVARRAGRYATAVELCDRLLSRYPDSPMAADARIERQRALDSDRSR